ncbi:MAG: hypothetical protein JO048_04230 [Methylobacteriaceae bacterium]|nr:hypothetical protein [Methylobacteriaceae bacterium]
MPNTSDLSDKAVAVFAFAAYHQLTSGQPVKSVIREDGKGHRADDEAIGELESRHLITIEGNDIAFSQDGLSVLASAIDGLKGAARRS